jgi:anti-sigma B factor antagonist
MKVELLDEPNTKVMAVAGTVTLDNCQHLLQQGKLLASDGFVDVVVDFGNVDFIDSAGIGTLISLSKIMRDSGGNLRLRNLGDNIRRVLAMARLDTFFAVS